MNRHRHVTLVATGATLLATLPLATVFDKWTWLVDGGITLLVISAVAVGLRSVRSPAWVPTAGMIAGFVLVVTWIFSSGEEFLGVLPTMATLRHFNELLTAAGASIRDYGVPVDDDPGLLFLATIGIGAVAIAVDTFAVVLRRPVLAGIPMAAIYLVAVSTHSESVSFLSFVAPAAGFLWLLVTDNVDRVRRFGRRFTGDGHDVDFWEPSPLAAAGRRLAMIGMAAAVLVPLAIPGMTTGLLDRFGSGVGAGPGTGKGPARSGSVNLFALLAGSLTRDKAFDMVKVTTNDPNPLYLRFGVADDLTQSGFRNRSPGPGQPLNTLAAPTPPQVPGVAVHTYQASIEVLNFDQTLLPLYQTTTRLDRVDNSWQFDRTMGVVYSTRSTARSKKYTFDYVRVDYSPAALRRAGEVDANDPVQRQFTRVPPVRAVQDKVAQLTQGKATPYDKVRAIYDYFTPNNGFTYALATEPGNSGSQIVDFLTNKQGFCEQYAAAMAWLTRAAGIPARVAVGFTRGGDQRPTSAATLTNYNLHAWTEVYFAGFGWVPFDPTPATYVSGTIGTEWAPDTSIAGANSGADTLDDLPRNQSASPQASTSADPFNTTGGPLAGGPANGSSGARWPLWVFGGLVLVLALASAPAFRRTALRRRRWPGRGAVTPPRSATGERPVVTGEPEVVHSADRDYAHSAWDELIDTMIDYRVTVDRTETPRRTAERLVSVSALVDQASDGARLLGHAEERARYARQPLVGPDLGASLAAVRSALRRRVSRRTRLAATLFPPSVMLRWRAGFVSALAGLTNGLARRRDALLRRISPRRLLAGRSGR